MLKTLLRKFKLDKQKTTPFTVSQEARLREIIRDEVRIGVAAGVGDTPRLLQGFDAIHDELALGTKADLPYLKRLVYLRRLTMDQVNAQYGIDSNFASQNDL